MSLTSCSFRRPARPRHVGGSQADSIEFLRRGWQGPHGPPGIELCVLKSATDGRCQRSRVFCLGLAQMVRPLEFGGLPMADPMQSANDIDWCC